MESQRLRSGANSLRNEGHDSDAIRRRQLRETTRRRPSDVKIRRSPVADAQVAEPDPVCVQTYQALLQKSPSACIEFRNRLEGRDIRKRALICEFYVMAHGACSGKSERMLFSFASQTPRSEIRPVTNSLGVTSKP